MLKKILLFILLGVSLYATTATKENVTTLYVATFNRAPDSSGLDYWVNSSNLSLEDIAESFFDQPEAQALYSNSSNNSSFIDSIYNNLFNRSSDQAGFNYWLDELNSGNIQRSVFILAVANGAQDADADILTNKTDVGLSFADSGLNDANTARDIMANVTDDRATITSALSSYSINLSSNTSFASMDSLSGVCSDTCQYANDNACDDGGLNSSYSVCNFGTDCGDCGSRETVSNTVSNDSTPSSGLISSNITTINNNPSSVTSQGSIIELGYGNQQALDDYTALINSIISGTASLDNPSDYNEYLRLLNEIANSDSSVSGTGIVSTGRSIVLSSSESDFTSSYSRTSSIENGQILAMIKVENLCKNTYNGTPVIASDLRTYETQSCAESTLFGETLYLCVVKATVRCSY